MDGSIMGNGPQDLVSLEGESSLTPATLHLNTPPLTLDPASLRLEDDPVTLKAALVSVKVAPPFV
jgi:hypothetical protein